MNQIFRTSLSLFRPSQTLPIRRPLSPNCLSLSAISPSLLVGPVSRFSFSSQKSPNNSNETFERLQKKMTNMMSILVYVQKIKNQVTHQQCIKKGNFPSFINYSEIVIDNFLQTAIFFIKQVHSIGCYKKVMKSFNCYRIPNFDLLPDEIKILLKEPKTNGQKK